MCHQCKTKPVYEFTNQRKLCKTCFIRWFQKKVLYTIRRFGTQGRTPKDFQRKSLQGAMIKSGDVVGYTKTNNFRSVVLEDVLKMFSEKAIVELVRLPSKKNLNKIAIASTTDLEADKIVHALIGKNKKKLNSPKDGKNIFPLYLFLDKEVLLYAKLRNLRFEKTNVELDEISKFIDELEEKHPEVKQAVVGGYLAQF